MQTMNRYPQAAGPAHGTSRWAAPQDPGSVASGQLALGEALQVLAQHREEQLRADADLREREAWAVTLILSRSEAVWDLLARPTLRFCLDSAGGLEPCHLQVGRFAHLAALPDPSPGERALLAAPEPCWARVYPHQARREAGQVGALARSYVPITAAEAVAAVGMGAIVAAIEGAVRAAGADLHARSEDLDRRRRRLLEVELMFGWDEDAPSVPAGWATLVRARLVLLLLGQGGRSVYLLGASLVGFLVILVCLHL